MKTSNLYSLDYRDLLKGLLMAVGAAVLLAIQQTLAAGRLDFDWKAIGMTAVSAAGIYLTKNFFTQSSIKTIANTPTLVTKVEASDPALVETT